MGFPEYPICKSVKSAFAHDEITPANAALLVVALLGLPLEINHGEDRHQHLDADVTDTGETFGCPTLFVTWLSSLVPQP